MFPRAVSCIGAPAARLRALLAVLALGVLGAHATAGDGAQARAGPTDVALLSAELGREYDDAAFPAAAGSPEPRLRQAAARSAGRLRDPRAVEWLLPLLRDEAGAVRRAALFALGQIAAPSAVVAVRASLPGLGVQDLPFALEALGKCGDARAASDVVGALRAGDAHVRAAAALALFRLRDTSVVPDLISALAAEADGEARWRLAYACARLLRERARAAGAPVETDAAWTRILRASASAQRPFEERVFATMALGELKGTQEPLLALLGDADARVVVAALRALARAWDAAVAERVIAMLAHEDPLLRETALEYLIAGGKGGGPLLRDATVRLSTTPRLCTMAAVAAAAAGEDVPMPDGASAWTEGAREEWQWRVLSHSPARLPGSSPHTSEGRLAAAEVCGEERVPQERALAELLPLLADPDFTIRSTAIASLGKRGDVSRAPAIVAAAQDAVGRANLDIRVEAAGALKALGQFDPWLRIAAREDGEGPVRAAARDALLGLGKEPPPAPPPSGFRLLGLDAAGFAAEAATLRGARLLLETDRGPIEMVLLPDEAPVHCVTVARLARRGFYDGLTWHRVVADFVIQGGCPRGDGWGGPGYSLPDEIGTTPYVRGTVGMPKSVDDTGGCQIFITHLPTPHLDGRYTVFGQVVGGLEVVDRIRIGDRIVRARLVDGRASGVGEERR